MESSVEQALKLLKSTKVTQIVRNLRRLIEVPFNASVKDTLNTMHTHDIIAVAVAAPPGKWIGAGGTKILEADKVTGAIRKHYIGLVSVLDILVHVVKDEHAQMTTAVSAVIGHSAETLNLWTIGPSTSIYDAIEPMIKGVHRVLVPFESSQESSTVELEEESPGYHIMTQMDLLQFILDHAIHLKDILSLSIADVGAVKRSVFAVPHTANVLDAFKSMAKNLLPAVAIVESLNAEGPDFPLFNGESWPLLGTLSASDLRGCSSEILTSWSSLSVLEWAQNVYVSRQLGARLATTVGTEAGVLHLPPPVTCRLSTPLGDVMALALGNRVHRIWVVNEQGLLMGLVALSDILSVFHRRADVLLSNLEQAAATVWPPGSPPRHGV